MREVPGPNPIGDITFVRGKTCSTVTKLTIVTRRRVLVEQELFTSPVQLSSPQVFRGVRVAPSLNCM